ncbi:hypothetical protein [Iodobacter sp.]|uniref:hypothetical protein n=1 Tax=Iodobacter sp. TaxID=1915058 RepID=UPI0025F78866|nr:hypothetical protein [Iodobacter sp.]
MRGFLIKLCLIFGVMIIWFWPNIQGHYRFKQYCSREGGIRIYGEILPDQGWLAAGNSPDDYKLPFAFKRVAFVRYKDKSGIWFDVYAKFNPWPKDLDYILEPVDKSKSVMYMIKNEFIRNMPNELRLGKDRYEIYVITENKVIASTTNFQYEQFERGKTFLGAPSGVVCEEIHVLDEFIKTIFPMEKK